MYIQWNLSNPDTNGAEESVIVSEVFSFQRLKCMQEWYYLGWEKVSCLERCPQFRSVLIERKVHCTGRCAISSVLCTYVVVYTCTPTRMSRRWRSNALSVESVGSGVRLRKEVGRSVNRVLDSDGMRVRMERSEVD